MQHTLGIIKSGYSRYLGEVLDSIYSNSLSVSQLQFGSISKEIGISLLKEHRKEQTFENLLNSITKDSIIAIDIVGNNSILKWKEIIERKFWNEICYGSETLTSSTYEIEIIFNQRNLQIKSLIDGTTTLCLIKPHAIKSGVSGKIIQQILKNGFEIVGAMMTTFNIEEASEFFEIYRGVVDNYYEISRDLASGPILALELYKEDAVNSLREICGPRDVSIAKAIRPQSIRALYGINNIQNAVHCTDLKEESQIECEFFFNLLSN
ncbi:Nucleoside diphosphate kinase family protein [Histomonas meleagridis]|nr:Nucleoside diphosphate kinase family protein [Histomonas meleagridis]